jgi:hypothetical protein
MDKEHRLRETQTQRERETDRETQRKDAHGGVECGGCRLAAAKR